MVLDSKPHPVHPSNHQNTTTTSTTVHIAITACGRDNLKRAINVIKTVSWFLDERVHAMFHIFVDDQMRGVIGAVTKCVSMCHQICC